jgi:hypothetical protein
VKRIVLLCAVLAACAAPNAAVPEAATIEFVCPMDPDVRSAAPGKCRKCGMPLVAGIPEPREYRVRLETPALIRPAQPVELTFRILEPDSNRVVTRFDLVHEKYFHLFIVSRDLTHFAHEHPEPRPGGAFVIRTAFPKSGEYRLLSDFYPTGATPQIIGRTVIIPGPPQRPQLAPDLAPKETANLRVQLRTEPTQALAGLKTMLFFDLQPDAGLEPYLGAWGHMLVASADLIDMIHSHPAFDEGGSAIQFNVIFPRPGMHRVWVQFQRRGMVNTAAFNVAVSELK